MNVHPMVGQALAAHRYTSRSRIGPELTVEDVRKAWDGPGLLPQDAEARAKVLGIWPELDATSQPSKLNRGGGVAEASRVFGFDFAPPAADVSAGRSDGAPSAKGFGPFHPAGIAPTKGGIARTSAAEDGSSLPPNGGLGVNYIEVAPTPQNRGLARGAQGRCSTGAEFDLATALAAKLPGLTDRPQGSGWDRLLTALAPGSPSMQQLRFESAVSAAEGQEDREFEEGRAGDWTKGRRPGKGEEWPGLYLGGTAFGAPCVKDETARLAVAGGCSTYEEWDFCYIHCSVTSARKQMIKWAYNLVNAFMEIIDNYFEARETSGTSLRNHLDGTVKPNVRVVDLASGVRGEGWPDFLGTGTLNINDTLIDCQIAIIANPNTSYYESICVLLDLAALIIHESSHIAWTGDDRAYSIEGFWRFHVQDDLGLASTTFCGQDSWPCGSNFGISGCMKSDLHADRVSIFGDSGQCRPT